MGTTDAEKAIQMATDPNGSKSEAGSDHKTDQPIKSDAAAPSPARQLQAKTSLTFEDAWNSGLIRRAISCASPGRKSHHLSSNGSGA